MSKIEESLPITGQIGTAEPVDISALGQLHSTLSAWLLHLPNQAVAWNDYMLALIHLGPVLGQKEAIREYPEAEFELLMCALSPELNPNAKDPRHTFSHLEPVNYVAQFHGLTDDEARHICFQMAKAFCNGYLPAEPMRTTVTLPEPRPDGLIVPGEAVINIGDGPKIVDWGGTRFNARDLFKQLVNNTVEHTRYGMHKEAS